MSEGLTQGNTKGLYTVKATLAPAAVLTVTAVEQTFTVPGVLVGDAVCVSPPSITAGCILGAARVSAADTVGLTFVNPGTASVTPAGGSYIFTVFRPAGLSAKLSVQD